MKIIAFGTLKGGTGKTTVAFNIGGILAEEHKVLFIDVDPQSNLSDNVGIDIADQNGWSVRNIFDSTKKPTPSEVITKAPMEQLKNLDIIASHIRLTATELQLVATPGRERILQRWIDRSSDILQEYDYIIIDTNPSMGIVNQNAFLVSDSIILVSDVSMKSLTGAQLFTYLWGEVCENMDVANKTSALILNNFDKRTVLSREIKEYYQSDDEFKDILVDTVVPSRVEIKNTETSFLPINITAPNSDSCEAFRKIISELKERKVL